MHGLDFRRADVALPGCRRYEVKPSSRPALTLLPGQVSVRVYSPKGILLRTMAGRRLDDGRVLVRWRDSEEYAGVWRGWHVLKLRAEKTEES